MVLSLKKLPRVFGEDLPICNSLPAVLFLSILFVTKAMYAFKTATGRLFGRRVLFNGLRRDCFRSNSTLTKISYNELEAKYLDSGK
jgi:cell division protein FtsL